MLKVSENGRYFVDQNNAPFFWLGDTQWNLFRCHTLEEARTIIEDRKKKGFSVLQVMLLGFSREVVAPPVHGEAFFDKDPTKPNMAYFEHVDAVLKVARENGIFLAIGLDHPVIRLVDRSTARAYGKWIGERFKEHPNIIWVATYLIPEGENLEIMRELVYGLREVEGKTRLITCHPDPACPVATSGISHQEEWLDFNCIQTFSSVHLIYDSVRADYMRKPPKPVVMAEGAYEGGPEYGFEVTPYFVRKQAYLSYFAGGHHSYGHTDNWRVNPTWRRTLDAPGAHQMTVLKKIFTARKWWKLKPSQDVIVSKADGAEGDCKALLSSDGDLLMVYTSTPIDISVDLGKMSAKKPLEASWIDPRNGETISAGTVSAEGIRTFSCPRGWEDAILVIE